MLSVSQNIMYPTLVAQSYSRVLFIILSAAIPGINVFSRSPSSYQLLGLDFMVTDDFHIWFIEVNNYPLWPKGSPFVNDLMDRMGVSLYGIFVSFDCTLL